MEALNLTFDTFLNYYLNLYEKAKEKRELEFVKSVYLADRVMMTKENKTDLNEYIEDYYKEKERIKKSYSKPKKSKSERLKKAEEIKKKHQKKGGG